MSIAGLDPSGGAGLLADIKTFEQQRCLGFGVASAITAQTEDRFFHLDWLSFDSIRQQGKPLLDRYAVAAIKIGIVANTETLQQIITWLRSETKAVQIVWDPVITSSSGFRFMEPADRNRMATLLQQIDLVTPNTAEALQLGGKQDTQEAAAWLAQYTAVLLKGGHSEEAKGTDYLYQQGKKTVLPPGRTDLPAKHGSGCILSSAIAARLGLGEPLQQACIQAKAYIEKKLNSNGHLLAYHV